MRRTFAGLFQRSLMMYLSPFTGFDLIQFDLDIATPDGMSTSDWIKQEYGSEAEKLIRELIK